MTQPIILNNGSLIKSSAIEIPRRTTTIAATTPPIAIKIPAIIFLPKSIIGPKSESNICFTPSQTAPKKPMTGSLSILKPVTKKSTTLLNVSLTISLNHLNLIYIYMITPITTAIAATTAATVALIPAAAVPIG